MGRVSRDALVERLRRAGAGYVPRFARQASHAALVREFLRRMALWAEALHVEDDWPLFDIAALVAPGGFSEADLGIAPVPQLHGAFRALLAAAVHFAEVAAFPPETRDLPDPYEPIIRLFERGGSLSTEHGMIYAGTVGFPRRPFRPAAGPPLLDLDDAALDAM